MRASQRALLVVFLAQGVCFATLVSRVPALRDRYALGELELGLILALVPLIAGAGSLVAGRVAQRAGVVLVLRVATPATCLLIAGVAVAGSVPVLVAVLALFGLALGAADATMNAYGVAAQRAAGRPLMTTFHAAYSLGGILGSVAAAGRLPLAAVGVLAGAACVLAGRRLSRPAGSGRRHSRPAGPVRPRPRAGVTGLWRRIAVVAAAMVALFLVDAAVSTWGAAYLRDVLGAPDHLAALVYGCYAGATLLGRAVGDVLVRRFGAGRVTTAGGVLGAAGLLLVVTAPTPAAGLTGFALAGGGLSVVAPQLFAAAGRAVPENPMAAVARVNVCVYAGFVLGAPMVGAVTALASQRVAFAVALALVVGLVVARPLHPRGLPEAARRSEREP